MTRQLFTAADIRRLAYGQKSDLLIMGSQDLITPEAVDVARELGVRLYREPAPSSPVARPSPAPAMLPPLQVVRGSAVTLNPFGESHGAPGVNVRLADVITAAHGSPMAAGYMALDRGEFPWTLDYDEIDIVLEGELVITRGPDSVRGGPGDCIFIPKGSSITFGSPSHTRFVYVAFPADWQQPPTR